MEREVGRGIGMRNTCKSMADSCQCMTKPTTIKKKKENLKKIVIILLSDDMLYILFEMDMGIYHCTF